MFLKISPYDEILIPVAFILILLLLCTGIYKFAVLKTLTSPGIKQNFNFQGLDYGFRLFMDKIKNNKKIFIFLSFITSFLIFYLVFKNIIFGIFIGICVLIIISDFVESFKTRRKEMLHIQIIEFVNNTVVMLRAGKTMRSIFKESINWTKKPLRPYLLKLVNELDLNFSFDEALDKFSERCGSREITLFTSSLKINNKIGGDLVFILNSVANSLQKSLAIKTAAKTITVQSRYSANIISFSPVLILIAMFALMKSSISNFFSSGLGNIILVIGGILEITGIIFIKKILYINR
ncbi:MAG: type II secretion system F family protein [Actinobacteria bacterium]|nr:type II secretion system F family protein [Actinomycetota bacterium]